MPEPILSTGQVDPSGSQPAAPAAQPPVPAQPAQAPSEPTGQVATVAQPPAQPESDRTTDQFNKLIESNRRLFEANELLHQELQKRTDTNETFAPIQQTQVPQVNPEDFIETDPTTGEEYIDQKKLKSRLQEVQERATKAEQAVQNYIQNSEKRELDKQNAEAYGAYPQLNPNAQDFDLELHKQTRALIYDSMINPQDYGGRSLTFKEAADRAKGPAQVTTANTGALQEPSGEQPPAQPNEEGQTLKEQGSLAASSQPQQVVAQETAQADQGALVSATRAGDTWALAQRLVNTDHVMKKPEEEQTT